MSRMYIKEYAALLEELAPLQRENDALSDELGISRVDLAHCVAVTREKIRHNKRLTWQEQQQQQQRH